MAVRTRWRFKAHISELEYHAVILSSRWVCQQPRFWNSRVSLLIDNQAVCYGIRKGRGASVKSLLLLRRVAALGLLCNLRFNVFYVNTADNPADAPSRL
mmetsp:Transcript_8584/g.21351  ORF Transcript_8584/g.21351 Transcript_8584/m.21351 type:complete len:99 (-) Transcript_8584:944-1240(-)